MGGDPRERALPREPVADPPRRPARPDPPCLRLPDQSARPALAPPRQAGGALRAPVVRRGGPLPGGAPRPRRRGELLGLLVPAELLRGGARARSRLARLQGPRRD